MKFILYNNGSYHYYRSLTGGNPIIGKGDSGVVIKPDIKYHNDNYISKLFILPDDITIDEFKQLETTLNSLDQENKYHVPMIDIGKINRSHNLQELEYDDRERYTYIATYQYGGLSLDNLIQSDKYNAIITPFFCKELFNGFLNLFEGIIFFSAHGLNHNDIHPGNIVFLLENPSMMRFIDFTTTSQISIINRRFIQDVIDLLHSIERTLHKCMFIFKEKNRPFFEYLDNLLDHKLIKYVETLFRSDDNIKEIIIIKQKLKEEFDKIGPFLQISN